YVAGESLRHRLAREKQLPVEEALGITRQIASALGHAHAQNVIHRDLKPENILLHEGEAMVADFGIALAVSAAAGERLTETGLAVGTPEYMSPEQALSERQLDARSDIYSLGCVLYELLAGEPPYTGRTAQAVIAKRFADPVPAVRRLRPTIPASVEQALMKALVTRALALDGGLGEAHAVLGLLKFVCDFDWAGAEEEFRLALELSPGSADTYDHYGWMCAALGRYDEAIAMVKRAQELDPLAHGSDVASTLLRAGRYEEAAAAAARVIEFDPRAPRGHTTLGWAKLKMG